MINRRVLVGNSIFGRIASFFKEKINFYPYMILGALLIMGSLGGSLTLAGNQTQNPVEWLNILETEIRGDISDGSMLERLDTLEEMITGRFREGSIVERLSYIDNALFVNQPHDISFLYKIQALEWVLYKECKTGPIRVRLENIESLLFKKTFPGPLNKRLVRLVEQVFPGETIKGHWVTVPEGTLIKVVIDETVSSAENQVGDSFRFSVADTVIQNNMVIFPKGTTGRCILKAIKRPGKMGLDANMMLDFQAIRALDGTPTSLSYGQEASKVNRSRKLAVGASAAGMIFLGPEGILFGLAIKGKETVIPAGTEFYLQIEEPVRIYTISQ